MYLFGCGVEKHGVIEILAMDVIQHFSLLKSNCTYLFPNQDFPGSKEIPLREDFSKKLAQAASLDALKKQREQVLQYVTQLEKQLPSKAEMSALLSDINRAGLGRNLQFELFRPGQVSVKEYYAELPIAVRVTGRYHDIGAFAAEIANLSRIVTLNNLTILPSKDGNIGIANRDAIENMILRSHYVEQAVIAVTVEDHFTITSGFD